MPNTTTNLTNTILGTKVLESFTAGLGPVLAFSTNCSGDAVQRGDKIKVPFINPAAAAADWVADTGYTIQDIDAEGLDITINKRKYVSWGLTTQELSQMPQLAMERFAAQKGFALAKAVMQDIFSVFTVANYGDPVFTGAAGTFDQSEVADIETVCDEASWPDMERSMILRPAYHSAVAKDTVVIGTVGVEQSSVLKNSDVRRLHNFDLYKSPFIPANAINLIGVTNHPDAVLVAMRSLIPDSEVSKKIVQFGTFTDPKTGFTIVDREWFDPTLDRTVRVFECHYGYRTGNKKAAKLMVSAGV